MFHSLKFSTDPISARFISPSSFLWTPVEQLHRLCYRTKTIFKPSEREEEQRSCEVDHGHEKDVCFKCTKKKNSNPQERGKDGILAFHASRALIDSLLLMTTRHQRKIFKFKQWISRQDYRCMSLGGQNHFDVATFRHFPAIALISETWLTAKATRAFLQDVSRKSILDFDLKNTTQIGFIFDRYVSLIGVDKKFIRVLCLGWFASVKNGNDLKVQYVNSGCFNIFYRRKSLKLWPLRQ